MKYEESFGVIPLRKCEGRWEVFVIQHNRGHYWGFPKGHAEKGETPEQAAFRELKEETNLDFVSYVKSEPFVENYQFTIKGERISKRVVYFAAEVTGIVVLQTQEIQNGAWIYLPEAIDRITHQEGKTILTNIASILPC